MSLQPDQLVAGRYQVQRLLGGGARKRVHLAHDTWLDRPVVVSTLRQDVATAAEVARLRREAAWLARLGDHPGIATVHDCLDDRDGTVLVCQYLPGGSLEDRLAGGGLPVAEVIAVGRDLAAALGHVHAHGVVHRDVKPANIWFTEAGQAVLGDFGLAIDLAEEHAVSSPYVGTLGYLAPEQALGGVVDHRADLYSLGAVLHEMLTGRRPSDVDDPLPAVSRLLPVPPEAPSRQRPDVPDQLDHLVLRLMATQPHDRPRDAAEVADELARLAAGLTAPADPAPAGSRFVGRTPELVELRAALRQSAEGDGGLTLLVGEAGVGKTRTALELARAAAGEGWLVLPGRCHEADGAPALWPWTQVLRAALRERPALTAQVAGGGGPLSALLPELGPAEGTPSAPLDVDNSRFELFDAVAGLLRELSSHEPVLVLVDDAHWADVASVDLTRFLGRELVGARVALLACLRDPPGDGAAPGTGPLDRLTGTARRTVTLAGMPLEDAARFLEGALGVPPTDALLRSLHRKTDGNPFFLGELVRLLVSEQRIAADGSLLPGETPIPQGIHEVLRRRLAHVSPACGDLLRAASVLGRETRLDVLCRVAEGEAEQLVPLLDEACRARLVVPLAGGITRYRFSHALVHDALYEQLPAVDRLRLHRRAGSALAAVHVGDADVHAAELAHHFVRGLPGGDVAQAVQWSVRAGRAASASAAHEDAVTHYERALSLTESLYSPDESERPDVGSLLLALGEAQCRAGSTDAGRSTFQRAADEGLLRSRPELLAEAALGYGVGLGGFGFVESADGLLIALLEQALDALDDGDGPLRLRVLSRLATELYFTPFRQRRLLVSDQALEMARRLGDPAGELVALYSRTLARLGPDDVDERRDAAERIVRLATAVGDRDMAFRGHHLRLNWAMEAGTLEQIRADVAACRRLADEQNQPMQRCWAAVFEASLDLLAGRLTEAMRGADAALEMGRRGHAGMATVLHGAQLLTVHWARGRIADAVDGVRVFADAFPHAPAWRAALAFCYAELDRLDAARVELDALAAHQFRDLPRDGNYLTALSLLAHAAARVGDLERVAVLERLLAPYAGRSVVIAAGAVAFTAVELPLGVLRAAAGDLSGALELLAAAAESHRSRGARPLLVWALQEQVEVLLRRDAPGDREAARTVLAEALPLARAVGMTCHVDRLSALAARLPTQGPPTLLLTDVADSTLMTERLGERAMHDLLREQARRTADSAARHGGTVLKSLGDGALVAFADAEAAVRCAADLQRTTSEAGVLRLRIGLHTGEVLAEGRSMYGRTVILAFRVADRARAGEVLVSAETRRAVESDSELRFDSGTRLTLKGIDEPQQVYRLLWGEHAADGPPAPPGPAVPRRHAGID